MKWAEAALVTSICVLAFVGICLFLWHIEDATPWRVMNAGDWGTWFGAVGTVATLGMTIRLATEASRIRRDEELSLALVATAGITARLRNIVLALAQARATLEAPFAQPDDPRVTFATSFQRIDDNDLWTAEELVPLVYLPNQIAVRLAWIGTDVRTTKAMFKDISNQEDELSWEVMDLLTRGHIYRLNSSLDDIGRVMGECTSFLLEHGFEKAVPSYSRAFEKDRA